MRLSDFLSSCLKTFMSPSICLTRCWKWLVTTHYYNSLLYTWNWPVWLSWASLAPSLREEAVARAEGRMAAAVAARRVLSLGEEGGGGGGGRRGRGGGKGGGGRRGRGGGGGRGWIL